MPSLYVAQQTVQPLRPSTTIQQAAPVIQKPAITQQPTPPVIQQRAPVSIDHASLKQAVLESVVPDAQQTALHLQQQQQQPSSSSSFTSTTTIPHQAFPVNQPMLQPPSSGTQQQQQPPPPPQPQPGQSGLLTKWIGSLSLTHTLCNTKFFELCLSVCLYVCACVCVMAHTTSASWPASCNVACYRRKSTDRGRIQLCRGPPPPPPPPASGAAAAAAGWQAGRTVDAFGLSAVQRDIPKRAAHHWGPEGVHQRRHEGTPVGPPRRAPHRHLQRPPQIIIIIINYYTTKKERERETSK